MAAYTEPTVGAQTGVASQFADYIVSMRERNLDTETNLQAVRCIFDLLIAAAAGAQMSGPTATRDTVLMEFKDGSVPIWFTGSTSCAIGAAYANAAAAAVLDLDDGTRSARGHAGAAVIPTAFAIGAHVGACTEDILKAVVIGYEVAVTVGAARKVDDFGYSMTWCVFGVVAAAGFLMKLPKHVLEHAFGIAGELIPTHHPVETPRPELSDVKEGIPWAVYTGIHSVHLAKNGHTGARNILEIEERYDYPADLSLSKNHRIFETYFKLYTTCRYIHSPIDATLSVIEKYGLPVGNIANIDIYTIAPAVRLENKVDPHNLTDVAYSTPYSVALVVLHGRQSLLPLREDSIGLAEVSKLARKINVIKDDQLDAEFPAKTLARVVITTTDGQVYRSGITAPKGEATDPLSWGEIEDKCHKATRFVATEMQQDGLISNIVGFRDQGDIKKLVEFLTVTKLCKLEKNKSKI